MNYVTQTMLHREPELMLPNTTTLGISYDNGDERVEVYKIRPRI